VVRNVLRWLIVKFGGERPTSMTNFFAIDVGRFGGGRKATEEGQKQLQVFSNTMDRKMRGPLHM
jgi:hypothetical protein